MVYKVTDDSGFLAIINPLEYISFVDEDWELDQLIKHFKNQIKQKNMLIWGTGLEAIWDVKVKVGITDSKGFREFKGFIEVTANKLCLTNYESLTMAAQFEDVKLPELHQKNLEIKIRNGLYQCRIVQILDPNLFEEKTRSYDFLIELQSVINGENNLETIPWFDFK